MWRRPQSACTPKFSWNSISEHFLFQLAALLGFERQSGRGAGEQTAHPDRLAGFIAVTVVTRINVLDGLLDLLEQLAFAVAGAQLQSMLLFDGGAIGRVRDDHGVFAQMLGGFTGVGQDVLLELHEFATEVGQLHVVHVLGIGHGDQVGIGQLLDRLGLPVVGEFGVFFGDHRH